METKLLTLTEQYPHLKDLFLLYGKADRFGQEVTGLLGTNGRAEDDGKAGDERCEIETMHHDAHVKASIVSR